MQVRPDEHPKQSYRDHPLALLLLRLLENLLNNLLLLNQECSNDTIPNTIGTS
jgi:hypothetical protein